MPDEVIKLLDKMAEKDGITRESVLFEIPDLVTCDDDDEDEEDRGPTYKEIPDDRVSADVDGVEVEVDRRITDDPEPIESDLRANEQRTGMRVPEPQADWVRRSVRLAREIRDRPDEETVNCVSVSRRENCASRELIQEAQRARL